MTEQELREQVTEIIRGETYDIDDLLDGILDKIIALLKKAGYAFDV